MEILVINKISSYPELNKEEIALRNLGFLDTHQLN